jgi:hypothetical protein
LFAGLELVELIYGIQTNENYFFLSLNKQSLLFVKAKYFRYSLFNLGVEIFFLCLDGLLVRYKKHFVPLAIIASLVLTGAFGTTSILRIRDSYVSARLIIKVNGFFVVSIWGYLVSVSLNIIS